MYGTGFRRLAPQKCANGSRRPLHFDASPPRSNPHPPAAGDADHDGHDDDDTDNGQDDECRQGKRDPATGTHGALHHRHLVRL